MKSSPKTQLQLQIIAKGAAKDNKMKIFKIITSTITLCKKQTSLPLMQELNFTACSLTSRWRSKFEPYLNSVLKGKGQFLKQRSTLSILA